jgi:hypothetical protein
VDPTPEDLAPTKKIMVKGVFVGASVKGDMLIAKLRDFGNKHHILVIGGALAHWFDENKHPLRHGPYDVPTECDPLTESDWSTPAAIIITGMKVHQNVDDDTLTMTSDAMNGQRYQFSFLPAAHADLREWIAQYLPGLIDLRKAPPAGAA